MPVDLLRGFPGAPLPTAVFVVADQFFLFGIHRDDGNALAQGRFDHPVDITKLRVAIWMVVAFLCLAVALQAVTILTQKFGDLGVADRMLQRRQFRRQRARALQGPAQGRLRIAACRWFDQAVQYGHQIRIVDCHPVPAATWAANSSRLQRFGMQFRNGLG